MATLTRAQRLNPEASVIQKMSCGNCGQEVLGTPSMRPGMPPLLQDHYCVSEDASDALDGFFLTGPIQMLDAA